MYVNDGKTWDDRLKDMMRLRVPYFREVPMLPGEDLSWQSADDFSAASVLFSSHVPEDLLERVRKVVFPTFGPQQMRRQGGWYWSIFRIATGSPVAGELHG